MPDEPQDKQINQPDVPEQDSQEESKATNFESAPIPAVEKEPGTSPEALGTVKDEPVVGADVTDTPAQTAPVIASTKGKSKKKWYIAGSVAVLFVALLGSAAYAYNVWYQNPQRVISDGIVNLVKSSSSVKADFQSTVENDSSKITVSGNIKGDQDLANGTVKVGITFKGDSSSVGTMNLSADFASNKDTLFFKLKGLKPAAEKLVDSYVNSLADIYKKQGFAMTQKDIAAQKKQVMDGLSPLINKLENRWIKTDISSKDTSESSGKCVTDVTKKLMKDDSQLNEVKKAYMDNDFIVVKKNLGSKDGSFGYLLDVDKTAAKEFEKALESTKYGKALKSCDSTIFSSDDEASSSDNNIKNASVELWVSQWSHQITELKASGETMDPAMTMSFDVKFDHSKVSGLTTPDNATDINDLGNELQGLLGGSFSSTSSPSVSI